MGFDEPEIAVGASGDLSEDVRGVGVLEFIGALDSLSNEFTVKGDGMGEFRVVLRSAGNFLWILRLARMGSCGADGPLGGSTELDNPLGDDIDMFSSVGVDLVEKFVQGDEVRPLHIPMRLLGLHHEVDRVGQALLEQLTDLEPGFLR